MGNGQKHTYATLCAVTVILLGCGEANLTGNLTVDDINITNNDNTTVVGEETGSLSGTIMDAVDYSPLAGATVKVSDRTSQTDASGLYTIDALKPGEYAFRAELTGYELYSDTVSIAVGANQHSAALTASVDTSPKIHVIEPLREAVFHAGSVGAVTAVTFEVDFENFAFTPEKVGQAKVDGEGHYHVYIDGAPKGPKYTTTIQLDLPAKANEQGTNVKVELHHNDHSAYVPEISDERFIFVLP